MLLKVSKSISTFLADVEAGGVRRSRGKARRSDGRSSQARSHAGPEPHQRALVDGDHAEPQPDGDRHQVDTARGAGAVGAEIGDPAPLVMVVSVGADGVAGEVHPAAASGRLPQARRAASRRSPMWIPPIAVRHPDRGVRGVRVAEGVGGRRGRRAQARPTRKASSHRCRPHATAGR